VYDEKVYQLSMAVGKEAAKRKVKVFLEMSTAQVYDSDKVNFIYVIITSMISSKDDFLLFKILNILSLYCYFCPYYLESV